MRNYLAALKIAYQTIFEMIGDMGGWYVGLILCFPLIIILAFMPLIVLVLFKIPKD
jgi:hypothetical protein